VILLLEMPWKSCRIAGAYGAIPEQSTTYGHGTSAKAKSQQPTSQQPVSRTPAFRKDDTHLIRTSEADDLIDIAEFEDRIHDKGTRYHPLSEQT
jgi:hypothetical protein